MLTVLGHRGPGHPCSTFHLLKNFILLLSFFFCAETVLGQLVNGQVFTSGLAILDAPAPNGVQNAGGNMPVAIDISGDGKLDPAASIPGSNLPIRFDFLEIYLVSSQTKTNLTISQGPGLLTQESGSTVKHLNFALPTCLSPGNYNFTIYEGYHINGQAFFSITPVLIPILNPKVSGPCTQGTNPLQTQPQISSPFTQNIWLHPLPTPTITVTMASTGVIGTPSMPYIITETQTSPSTVTIIVVSLGAETFTSTVPGATKLITSAIVSTFTTKAPMQSGNLNMSGFFPVNAAASARTTTFIPISLGLGIALLLMAHI